LICQLYAFYEACCLPSFKLVWCPPMFLPCWNMFSFCLYAFFFYFVAIVFRCFLFYFFSMFCQCSNLIVFLFYFLFVVIASVALFILFNSCFFFFFLLVLPLFLLASYLIMYRFFCFSPFVLILEYIFLHSFCCWFPCAIIFVLFFYMWIIFVFLCSSICFCVMCFFGCCLVLHISFLSYMPLSFSLFAELIMTLPFFFSNFVRPVDRFAVFQTCTTPTYYFTFWHLFLSCLPAVVFSDHLHCVLLLWFVWCEPDVCLCIYS
jgi:hypothetical protein